MYNAFRIFSCLVLFAGLLSTGFPVQAQELNNSSPAMQGNSSSENHGWNGECPERQELREEREHIRAEHEQLESEHDTLKVQCMNSKGQDRSDCHQKAEALHGRADALRERVKALHEKVAADAGCRPKGGHKGPETWPAREATANNPSPTAPAGQ